MTNSTPGKQRIGILGGMGPEATVLLMSRIIELTPAQDDHDHVPMIVDNNTQVPSRIAALIEKTGADPGPVLVDMARRLEAAGVAALAMPCNTAHCYASRIQAAVSIPLLNMVELSADASARVAVVTSGQAARVGILASPAVRITGLFDAACAARGIDTVYPSDQDALLASIRAVKRGARAQAIEQLKQAALELQQQGVGVVLVACTELSLIREAVPEGLTVIDTMDVLANAVVEFASAKSIELARSRPGFE